MRHTLDTRIRLPQPRDEVFPFFCDANNLERITPDELEFSIETPAPIDLRQGARIRYRLKLWGVPFSWETEITCWEPPYRFVDEQASGPYRRWVHRHELVETPDGTVVYDHVDYELPFGILGNLFHPLLRRQLVRIFRYRHAVLHRLFGSQDLPEAPVLIDTVPGLRGPMANGPASANWLAASAAERGWEMKLLYDGACPFCRREINWLKDKDHTNRIELEDISADGFDASRYGLTHEMVDGKIHAFLADGSVITGMEVFRRLYAAVGLGWLLAPTGWPVIRPVADYAYGVFARNRVRLGHAAGRDQTSCRSA
jgi:ligand-binding SRPBCC domain-containing protein/predicted DCC family thiol-disulfide oxidoreductase YuxK